MSTNFNPMDPNPIDINTVDYEKIVQALKNSEIEYNHKLYDYEIAKTIQSLGYGLFNTYEIYRRLIELKILTVNPCGFQEHNTHSINY